jgi:hypothetical protein
MPGYYSGLLEGMLAKQQIQGEQALTQERMQKIEIGKRNMALQDQERQLMMQAFSGGADARVGLEQAQDLQARADRLSAVARRILPFNPKVGLDMMKESDAIKSQKALQDQRNVAIAAKKNELLGTVAMTVTDQASLNDAVQELTQNGIAPPPPKYRTWGPEAQQWWSARARIAKRNLDSLRTDATLQRAQTAEEEAQRKTEHDRVRSAEKDREDELRRHGEYMKVESAIHREYTAAEKVGDTARMDEYARQLEGARRKYKETALDINTDPEAQKVKEDFSNGKITKDEAIRRLRTLGYE